METSDAMHQNTAPIYKLKFNKKFVSFDGFFEVVYAYDNSLVTEEKGDEDMGTYNYLPSGKNFMAFKKRYVYL